MCFHIDSIYANVVKCIYTDLIHFKIELCLNFILEHRRHRFYGACVNITRYRPSLQSALLFGKPMAGHLMARRQFNQFRLFVLAAFRAVRATVAERTSRRQVQRTGRFALDILNLLGKVHLGIKDRGQQCP